MSVAVLTSFVNLQSLPFVDLNCRTLDGSLPEDLTTDKSLVKQIKQARSEMNTKLVCCSLLYVCKLYCPWMK